MKVLIIPENPTLDQHILKPVVTQIFRELGRKARIEVLQDPHLNGVDQALDSKILGEIQKNNRMIDLFLVIVDRDCQQSRAARLTAREEEAREHGRQLIGCLAIEEVEVWALALHRNQLRADWKTKVRRECDPKDVYFEPFIKRQKWLTGLGRGRAPAMSDLSRQWDSLKKLCPEIQTLADRIGETLANQG